MSSRFAMAAHIVGLLAWHQRDADGASGGAGDSAGAGQPRAVSSDVLAGSINTHPVVVRRLLAQLKAAGLVNTRRGAHGGSVLACDPTKTSLRVIYDAVVEDEALLVCAPGSAQTCCEIGQRLHGWLQVVFSDAEEALKHRLDQVTVADMRDQVAAQTGCADARSEQVASSVRHGGVQAVHDHAVDLGGQGHDDAG